MKGLLKLAFAVAGAGVGVMLTTKYLLKSPDGSGGFVPIGDGFGWDDAAQGAGALAGAWAGHKVGSLILGKM